MIRRIKPQMPSPKDWAGAADRLALMTDVWQSHSRVLLQRLKKLLKYSTCFGKIGPCTVDGFCKVQASIWSGFVAPMELN